MKIINKIEWTESIYPSENLAVLKSWSFLTSVDDCGYLHNWVVIYRNQLKMNILKNK